MPRLGIFLRWSGLLVLLVGNACAGSAHAADRVALVIGNTAYQHLPRLANPARDAQLIAATLQSVGFQLIGGKAQTDLDRAGLERAIRQFGSELAGGSIGLFYYAGHGIQVKGTNYLVLVGANPTGVADIDFELIDTELVLKQLEAAGSKLNFVILDACRNNPFGGRGLRDSGGGLARMNAPTGTLISYATQPGNVALDGTTGHSPYTAALATTIKKPGLRVLDVFNEVGLAVDKSTRGRQQPWQSSSPIDGNFYFLAPTGVTLTSPVPDTPAQVDREAMFWDSIKSSQTEADFNAYLKQFPEGTFASLARNRIASFRVSPQASGKVEHRTIEIARAFYTALSQADGVNASKLVIPQKRTKGAFSASEITRFYSSLTEPLHLLEIRNVGPNAVEAKYEYGSPDRRKCWGQATMNFVGQSTDILIDSIRANYKCDAP
jgi:hypothetical protein